MSKEGKSYKQQQPQVRLLYYGRQMQHSPSYITLSTYLNTAGQYLLVAAMSLLCFLVTLSMQGASNRAVSGHVFAMFRINAHISARLLRPRVSNICKSTPSYGRFVWWVSTYGSTDYELLKRY